MQRGQVQTFYNHLSHRKSLSKVVPIRDHTTYGSEEKHAALWFPKKLRGRFFKHLSTQDILAQRHLYHSTMWQFKTGNVLVTDLKLTRWSYNLSGWISNSWGSSSMFGGMEIIVAAVINNEIFLCYIWHFSYFYDT